MAESTDPERRRSEGSVAPREGLAYVCALDDLALSPESIADALIQISADAPDRPAVMWASANGPRHVSWSLLLEHARRYAAALLASNPTRDRVGLAGLNSVEWIAAMFGCALTGTPVVPLSASATDEELRYQIEAAEVGLILAAKAAGRHRVYEQMVGVAECMGGSVQVLELGAVAVEAGAKSEGPFVPVSADDEFLVQFTSGTTGRPKAASLSHRAALNCGLAFSRAWDGGAETRFLNPLPLHHVGGSITGVITALAMGGTYVLMERFDPGAALDTIRQTRPTVAGLVPTMMIDLLAQPGVTPADFASLRTVIGGATAVDPGLIAEMEHRLGLTVIGSYGQSEAPAMLASARTDPPEVRMQTLGRCLPGRDIAIRDSDGNVVVTGETGELCVRGPLTMSGYLLPGGGLDPAVDAEGWRRTGDLCSMDDTGVLTFRGRIREVIIRGGLNIYPAEVEQAITAHKIVAEAVVFGVPDPRLGERVVAAVIAANRAAVDIGALSELVANRLSSYKHPAEWLVVETLPRTSTGKVRKHLLQEWYVEGALAAKCGSGPLPGDRE